MASPFDDLDALVSGAIGDAFGEVAVLRPRISSQYVERADDPSRPIATVTGVFSAGPADDKLKGGSAGSEFSGGTRVVSQSAEFWLPAEQVRALVARPVKGDALTLTGRDGAPVYSISQVHPSDMGDLNLILTWEDQPT
jgi:hypothetical protein